MRGSQTKQASPQPDGDNSSHLSRRFLNGQILVAMPDMADQYFAKSVIYLCAHSEDGAMGIILNQPSQIKSFPDLLVQLQIIAPQDRIHLPSQIGRFPVLSGGPVQTDRGFILHTPDFHLDQSTMSIDDSVSLTATIDVLRAIASGDGPSRAMMALGYAGWDPGQLENEIQHNGWLHCPADPALVFDQEISTKYARALRSIGVELGQLSSFAGHG
jgi:putative transcriptional regulator